MLSGAPGFAYELRKSGERAADCPGDVQRRCQVYASTSVFFRLIASIGVT